jgi:hypothetical protein
MILRRPVVPAIWSDLLPIAGIPTRAFRFLGEVLAALLREHFVTLVYMRDRWHGLRRVLEFKAGFDNDRKQSSLFRFHVSRRACEANNHSLGSILHLNDFTNPILI